ncbi:MAG TPA: hypothetical protein VGE21_00475 [Flavobacteriales bacterium]
MAAPTANRPVPAACLLFLVLAIGSTLKDDAWREQRLLTWDSCSYQLYLAGALVGDPFHMAHLRKVEPSGFVWFGEQNALQYVPERGTAYNKFPIGPALFQAPFFLCAHAYCLLFDHTEVPDGYSPPYQLSAAIASACWACCGLLLLGRFLQRWTDPWPAAIALLALGLGTNLFHYATRGAGMAHPYLFFLFAAMLERTDAWFRKPTRGAAVAIGAVGGLVLVTRSLDILVFIVPMVWWMGDPMFRARAIAHFRAHRSHGAWALLAAFVCCVPQMLHWRITTGHFIFDTYGAEHFNFAEPHVWEGLFGFRKGWFIYTPLMFLAWWALFRMVKRTALSSYAVACLAFFVPYIFLVFSWWCWYYGGGFGSRPMVDTLPLLGLPLAWSVQQAFAQGRARSALVAAFITAAIALNLFQSEQYRKGIIRWDGMTAARYLEVFGATSYEGLPPFDPDH